MTREEAWNRIDAIIARHEIDDNYVTITSMLDYDALRMARKALEQQPCEDAINRQTVLDIINFEDKWLLDAKGHNANTEIAFSGMKSRIAELPSVNPQPKTGHWIQTNEFFINQDGQFVYKFICSECKSISYFRKSNKKAIGANVCQNCGARMVDPQESEDME